MAHYVVIDKSELALHVLTGNDFQDQKLHEKKKKKLRAQAMPVKLFEGNSMYA